MRTKTSYLLDTHAFLWAISAVDKLSENVLNILENNSSEVYLSKVSYWEICLKISKGKLRLGEGWQSILEKERKQNRFRWLEIEPSHCEGILTLPDLHKDPFDRMLISQSLCEGLILLSCDQKIADYAVELIW